MKQEQLYKLKELIFFGYSAVEAINNNTIVCDIKIPAIPSQKIKAAAIVAGDLLTAHLSYDDWVQVDLMLDQKNTVAVLADENSYPIKYTVSLCPIAGLDNIEIKDKSEIFEIAVVLFFACQAIAKLWNDRNGNTAPLASGEVIFWQAISGYEADKIGLNFARHLRISGAESPTMQRFVERYFNS